MPIHFDRFRLLNGSRLRNEGERVIWVRATEEDPQQPVNPGEEVHLPISSEGETIIEVEAPT